MNAFSAMPTAATTRCKIGGGTSTAAPSVVSLLFIVLSFSPEPTSTT
ncbi:hypothetical protein QGP82_25050 [Leptothoe sp. LEGE 181152]|nr:hypothetical protein [Leptothoe sp. LEGE 181152]